MKRGFPAKVFIEGQDTAVVISGARRPSQSGLLQVTRNVEDPLPVFTPVFTLGKFSPKHDVEKSLSRRPREKFENLASASPPRKTVPSNFAISETHPFPPLVCKFSENEILGYSRMFRSRSSIQSTASLSTVEASAILLEILAEVEFRRNIHFHKNQIEQRLLKLEISTREFNLLNLLIIRTFKRVTIDSLSSRSF